ncbi:hypothetical protein BDZ90DRAFT_18269 [Jaminaea rosea]|uniref:Transmembrane protein n=1 Tax=Jaminaea rosea TaxID=1569628 RepID=A0A316V021_9BASI|nr:hypothetical protein BDZ90DRAFT_18269 [Jaminaea rosea]PWN30584.1 hypothetical protein BDZ90DRAFT_18269 [Jaminaea rosea]
MLANVRLPFRIELERCRQLCVGLNMGSRGRRRFLPFFFSPPLASLSSLFVPFVPLTRRGVAVHARPSSPSLSLYPLTTITQGAGLLCYVYDPR